MSREIDKNDVDISQLFKWNSSVSFTDPMTDRDATVYLRVVGDADMNRAKAYALRKSAEMRKALKTEGSDERISFMNEINEFKDNETLISMIIYLKLPELHTQAIRNTFIKEPAEPGSDATLEEKEEYQKAIDEYPIKFADEVEKQLNDVQDELRNDLKGKHKDTLYETYQALLIDRLCSEEMNDRFYDMCAYYATYRTDEFKDKVFGSFEEFDNASTFVKNRLKQEYRDLEIGMGALKKLPEATE